MGSFDLLSEHSLPAPLPSCTINASELRLALYLNTAEMKYSSISILLLVPNGGVVGAVVNLLHIKLFQIAKEMVK